MSLQSIEVYRRCWGLVQELEKEKRLEDSVAVLRALSVYLDVLPAMPDRSCRGTVDRRLATTYALVREKESKEKR
jgi:hypothetical protein